ncbi:MAG TPA: LacI family transcriptional regulator [Chloroflexi bacterium]|nr:LacI family transcriptional regulator [Chloroflexota bacterium]
MSRTYTIRDVAKRAGVGVGTVSRVLNDHPSVSEETRQKVLAAIEELDFHPSPVARQLSAGGKTLAIGIIAPFFTRPAFVGRLEGIEAVLAQSEYDLVLYNVETPEQQASLFRKVPYERRVDGLIIISLTPSNEDVKRFERYGMPVVLLDTSHPDLPSITIDDVDGGKQATRHLVELGHRRIAYISDPLDNPFGFRSSALRLEGYREMLAECGIEFRPDYHRQGEHGRHVAHHLTQELMALPDPPTAIFAASDTQALGAIEAIRQMGLRVPEDISVIGYDDIEVAAYVGLTTIRQPMYQSGVESVKALFQLLDEENPSLPASYTLPVQLIERETTGPPAAA